MGWKGGPEDSGAACSPSEGKPSQLENRRPESRCRLPPKRPSRGAGPGLPLGALLAPHTRPSARPGHLSPSISSRPQPPALAFFCII